MGRKRKKCKITDLTNLIDGLVQQQLQYKEGPIYVTVGKGKRGEVGKERETDEGSGCSSTRKWSQMCLWFFAAWLHVHICQHRVQEGAPGNSFLPASGLPLSISSSAAGPCLSDGPVLPTSLAHLLQPHAVWLLRIQALWGGDL